MAITIEIKVYPSSGKQGFTTDKSGKIKCMLKSPPEKGKANKELISLISKLIKVPKDHIEIIIGLTSRNKTLRIYEEITLEDVYNKLGIETQISIV